MLANLLNVPRDHSSWERFFFDNKLQIDEIRQAIREQTGNILAVLITSNGSGYSSAPTVAINDPTGTGASAVATYSVSGGFYSITINVITQGSGYTNPTISLSGGGGSGATAVAEFKPVTNLTEYVLYPFDENNKEDFQTFLENNSQAHDDFNSQLGLQSSDIEELDPKDEKALTSWIYTSYQELYSASAALKI